MKESKFYEKLLKDYQPVEGLNHATPRILAVDEISVDSQSTLISKWAGASSSGSGTSEQLRYTRIMGRFDDGVDPDFCIYLPPKELWQGRFFQRCHPFLNLEATREDLEFYAESGAYTIMVPEGILGHVAHASAAHVSRTVAKNFYGYKDKIYGYLYGGSGGSMQSIGALEVSTGAVWDGIIPFITAAPTSLGNFCIRWFARAVLEEKGELIADAVRPGGDGDPYAGLNDLERKILEEVTKLGLPLIAWENYEYLFLMYEYPDLIEGLSSQKALDDAYTAAFWKEPGYLESYEPELRKVFYDLRERGVSEGSLATIAYHRHRDPGHAYKSWNHLRDSMGNPLFAQTEGEHYAKGPSYMTSGGSRWSGEINRKCIVVTNLMDLDAFPSDGDYYRRRVDGVERQADFRIWLNENADHHGNHAAFFSYLDNRLVDYGGIISQALLDLSAWVEEGIEPPVSTVYDVVDSQIVLEKDAVKRGGIQPGVSLTVGGSTSLHIASGDTVQFFAEIKVPKGTGEIVSVEWDVLGSGRFIDSEFEASSEGSWTASFSHTYIDSGVYLPQVRVASQRVGDRNMMFTRAYNLGRMRVTVGK